MLEGLYSAAAGMAAQQQRMETVSNDLANVSTSGYKRERTAFRDLVYTQAGRASNAGIERGAGAATSSLGRGFQQGAMLKTEEPFDFAIEGTGFFQVQRADGSLGLTRDGAFHPDPSGRLVTASGNILSPGVTIPAGANVEDITTSPDGQLTLDGRAIGRLNVVEVRAPSGLQSTGDGTFTVTAESGPVQAARGARVTQSTLEQSNVDMGEAMIDMMDAQRSFQLVSKAISMQDQMMEVANGVKR